VARTRDTRSAKKARNPIVEIVTILVAAVAIAFVVQLVLVKTYRIPSGSMEPTLDIGQRVLVNRIAMRFSDPSVGDIVVFHPPTGADSQPPVCGAANEGLGSSRACSTATGERSEQTFIKRVVGVGGDRIQIRDGHVIRNDRRDPDAFIKACDRSAGQGCSFEGTITVPDGSFFLMGDNRGESADSRFWGPVPKDWIIGTTIGTYWPPDRIGLF
jgi:signal peptidase I